MENDTETQEYNPLKDYLNHELEYFPDQEELERIIRLSLRQDAYNHNVGIRVKRTETSPLEKAFSEQWLKENEAEGFGGHGILQDLFIEKLGHPLEVFGGSKMLDVITNRDRKIVATVVQWLGSNVGMSFLYEVLRKVNLQIVEIKKDTDG